MLLKIFLRASRSEAFSIEEVFSTIMHAFPRDLRYEFVQLPFSGAGITTLIGNIRNAHSQQGTVNHITGDVQYIALGLPASFTLLTIHDLRILELRSGLKQWMIKMLWFHWPIKRVRYISVISEATKRALLKHIKVDPDKIYIIYNPVSPAFTFTPKNFEPENHTILHLGTKENKNLERLITAIEGLTCRLRIIGKLTSEQKSLLRKNKIQFTNSFDLTPNQIIEEFRHADLVSFVSLYEGFGMPIIEAQATGRPVITSNCSSMPEVAGEGALLVDPTSVEEIRAGILRLIHDESLRNSLIQKGLENVKRFDAKVIAEQYAALYRKIAAENA
jgi:glycosyltransferase involved in cell wall biosynthesis